MAKARMTHNWDIGGVIWATIANANRDPKKKPTPFSPIDIHPFRREAETRQVVPFEALKVLINGWQQQGNQGRSGVHKSESK